ncbi:MAG: hypothetical protein O2973_07510 [Gemmatimonadetes bacterium]|nr:hypothetical protein [Gemmatimonadota bacterium]
MSILTRIFAAGFAAIVVAPTAQAQFGGGINLAGTSVALSANAPMGKFDELVQTGYGIAIRRGAGESAETWTGRTNFSFDTFNGNVTYENVRFITFGFDIVHRSRRSFYQFGGIALFNTRITYKEGTNPFGNVRQSQDIGLTGGVGVNYGTDGGPKLFVEFAATTVFTTGDNTSWFPLRVGFRF